MNRKGRIVAGVVAGAVVWAVLWTGGGAAARAALPELLDPAQRLDHTGALLAFIAFSVVLSVLAGYVTAAVTGSQPMRAVWALAVVQLGLGLYFEVSYWDLMPAWYHLVFLALIVPATVLGGRLKAG